LGSALNWKRVWEALRPWKGDHEGDVHTLWGCLVDQACGIPCWRFGCRLHGKKIFSVISDCVYPKKSWLQP